MQMGSGLLVFRRRINEEGYGLQVPERCYQVNYMGYYLHRITPRANEQRASMMVPFASFDNEPSLIYTFSRPFKVENFALQLLHSPVRFGVNGCCNMDFVLLKSVIILWN